MQVSTARVVISVGSRQPMACARCLGKWICLQLTSAIHPLCPVIQKRAHKISRSRVSLWNWNSVRRLPWAFINAMTMLYFRNSGRSSKQALYKAMNSFISWPRWTRLFLAWRSLELVCHRAKCCNARSRRVFICYRDCFVPRFIFVG